MRMPGSMSWAIRENEARALTMALYIRDVAGLDTSRNPDAPPPLDPPITVNESWRVAFSDTGPEWSAWWSRLLRRLASAPSELAAFEGAVADATGEARRLLDATFPAAQLWQRDRDTTRSRHRPRNGLQLSALVHDIEVEHGRRAAPFRLTILTMPVRGVWSRHATVSEEIVGRPGLCPSPALLVSSQLRADPVELARRLRPILVRGVLGLDGGA